MSDSDIRFADTQEFRYSKRSIIRFFKDLVQCDSLVWLPAHNNLKYLFPFIWYASKLFRFRIIYIVIGGWLSTMLQSLNFHSKRLGKIEAILVENQLTVTELSERYHFPNVSVIPNFRDIKSRPKIRKSDNELKLVFMARINKMKGLDTIARVCERIPENTTIDFYGPIHPEDKEYFEAEIIDKYPFTSYKGLLNPNEINGVLQNYDVMLLPTHYYTEGLPGSIIDAYQAGIPVIVTRWKHASEFVSNEETGFIVDFENPENQLIERIHWLKCFPDELHIIKQKAAKEGLKYTPNAAWDILAPHLFRI